MPVTKRSVVIAGHKTSISLEIPFWNALKEIARHRQSTLSDLVNGIDCGRGDANLSSALRVFVFEYFRGGLTNGLAQSSAGYTGLSPPMETAGSPPTVPRAGHPGTAK
jgi:predicted DNA-binding ribbon-helix-helix protein